jgi:hypothetical protein
MDWMDSASIDWLKKALPCRSSLRWYIGTNYRKLTLATPNYGYEKRQKELAKKKKKEDKLRAKSERKNHQPDGITMLPSDAQSEETIAGTAPPSR